MSEKLQKVLARAGFGSRREIEGWISEGRVKVNGKVATLGDRVDPATDRLEVDGKRIHPGKLKDKRTRVLAYHKPVGKVCTRHDPEKRPTIYEDLPSLAGGRWISVGRLDLNTGGLLLLTTDGELANRLMHPSQQIEREYAVRVLGEVTPQMLKNMQDGVELEDGKAHFDAIRDVGGEGANHWYHVILREGRNREVRRLWESQGVQVSRLHRVRFGPIALPRWQKPGRWEDLDEKTIERLLGMSGLTTKVGQHGASKAFQKKRPRKAPHARRR